MLWTAGDPAADLILASLSTTPESRIEGGVEVATNWYRHNSLTIVVSDIMAAAGTVGGAEFGFWLRSDADVERDIIATLDERIEKMKF